jgi:hypothetical protein
MHWLSWQRVRRAVLLAGALQGFRSASGVKSVAPGKTVGQRGRHARFPLGNRWGAAMAYLFGGPGPLQRGRCHAKLPAALRAMPGARTDGGGLPRAFFEFLEQRYLGGSSGGNGGFVAASSDNGKTGQGPRRSRIAAGGPSTGVVPCPYPYIEGNLP